MGGDAREQIRKHALEAGADDVGIAACADYRSPRSPDIRKILPEARSIIVLAYGELTSCESPSPQIAMNGRLDLMEASRSANYKVARFVERELGARAVTVPVSYPLDMSEDTKGSVGEVSLRHAAVAAGLGGFGRHNLVVHPRLGTRVIFSAVVTDLDLPSDPALAESPCTECGLCVESCPGRALDQEGKTDLMKCLKTSQPYGLAGSICFWSGFGSADPEKQKAMLRDTEYWRLYQASFIGFQYFCFNCLKSCPVGQRTG